MSTSETTSGLIEISPEDASILASIALIGTEFRKKFATKHLERLGSEKAKEIARRLIDLEEEEPASDPRVESAAQSMQAWALRQKRKPSVESQRFTELVQKFRDARESKAKLNNSELSPIIQTTE